MEIPSVSVGIDVSKPWLDMALRPPGERNRVRYDAHGIAMILTQLSQVRPAAIVVEATGGLGTVSAARIGGRGLARDRRESTPGPGLCQGDGAVGQDGHA